MLYWILKPIVKLLSLLSLDTLHKIGRLLASLTWFFAKERRFVAIKNAEIVGVREEEREKIARKSFDYTFMAYMENFFSHRIDDKFIKENVKVAGLENIENLKEKNPLWIAISGHFGAWGMFPPVFVKILECNIVTVGRASHNKALNRIISELRIFDKVAYITHRGAIENLNKYIAKGYIPGVYLDHTATPKDCINVPFFGYKAPVIAGIYAFAVRKNLPILPSIFRFDENKKYEFKISEAIYPDNTLKAKERIYKLAEDVNKWYESVFSKYPEQWYLIHRRFKRVEEADGTISERVYRP